MECSLLLPYGGLEAIPKISHRPVHKLKPPSLVAAVMAEPKKAVAGVTPAKDKMVYKDNWFHRLAIHHLSESVQATTGMRNKKEGYESLVEAARMVRRRYDAKGQQELVIQSLHKACPGFILKMIKILLSPSKFSREYFATFTTIFFAWLVGYCEVRKSEVEGNMEKNVVYIPKCRFLESTNCIGMCTNLCKIPTQTFIKDSLGMPINMIPSIARQTHGANCSS